MKAKAVDPNTGKEFVVELRNISEQFFDEMKEFVYSESDLKKIIDSLNISADAKLLIHRVARVTIKVGKFIVNVGRKILDTVMTFFEHYPNATFGLILGFIMGTLLGAIPILGFALGAIATPLLSALGLLRGFMEDLKDKELERKLQEKIHKFESLKS